MANNSKTYLITGLVMVLVALVLNLLQYSWIGNTLNSIGVVFLIIALVVDNK